MTSTTVSAPSSAPASRDDRLVNVLGRASGRFSLLLTERWLFAIGGALAVAGVVAVIVGWVGTSRTVLVAGQIPYVVSGGLLGLGLIFLGGFLYFGHWMALLVREGRERAAEDRNDLARLRDSLGEINRSLAAVADVLGSAGVAPVGTVRSGTGAGVGSGPSAATALRPGTLVATASGTMMHRPDCPAVTGKENLREVSADEGLRPCGICRPLEED
jgi:hypothetical protein